MDNPQWLQAAQQRATPLAPRLTILRDGRWLCVLTATGQGIGCGDGKWLYGDTTDPLRAPSGVRVWVAERGKPRLYATAMPDFTTAEREYLAGKREVRLTDSGGRFSVTRDGLALSMRVTLCAGGERRHIRLHNRSNRPREVTVCVAVTPAFCGKPQTMSDGVLYRGDERRLRLWVSPHSGAAVSGVGRLRAWWRLLLPAGGVFEEDCCLTAGDPPAPTFPLRMDEPLLSPESVWLAACLYPTRSDAAFITATEALADTPPTDFSLPALPFFYLEVPQTDTLPLLHATLTRLCRLNREGIPTALALAVAPEVSEDCARLCTLFSPVPTVTALLADAPLLWRAACCLHIHRQTHLPAALSVPYTPLPLLPLTGGSLRRKTLPPLIGTVPHSVWAILRHEGRLYSLLHNRQGGALLPVKNGGVWQVRVLANVTAQELCVAVTLRSRLRSLGAVSLALYVEPQLFPPVPSLTLSQWDSDSGSLTLTHPLAPEHALTLTATGGADGFVCDRAAFWSGQWDDRRPCPLRLPSAAVLCARRLPPRGQTTVVFRLRYR